MIRYAADTSRRSFPRLRGTEANFASTLVLAIAVALVTTVIVAPFAADAIALAGFRIPFSRIFDRVVMVAAGGALILFARPLRLPELLRGGFDNLRGSLLDFGVGLAVAISTMAILFATAILISNRPVSLHILGFTALRYAAAALLIGIIEEAFFRAILLGGLIRDVGRRAALVFSSLIYALTHLIRSPAHYYLYGLHPAAGLDNLAASASRLIHPGDLIAMVFGLFLLGLVLGEAFLLTRRVYASIGLHAGFVIGAKCWPVVVNHSRHAPGWLAGSGPIPLIAAPAAWALAAVILIVMPLWLRRGLLLHDLQTS